VAARSEGGGVKVNGGIVTITKSLRKRATLAHSEGGVEVAACSGDGDEAVVCSRARIIDDRWWWWRGSFYGDSRARESVRSKIC
jgi:hypothetical protein